ncbi:ATP-binding protein [Azospirillum sp. sgz302134]
MSILVRLLLLVLLALAPIAALEVWNQFDFRRDREEEIRGTALQLLGLLGGEQQRLVEGVRQMLSLLAETRAARDLDAVQCQELLERTRRRIPHYLTINLASRDGVILCSTDTALAGLTIADRAHVQAALESGTFTVGEFIRRRPSDVPAMPFGLPIRQDDGSLVGVVTVLIDLGWLASYLADHPLPPNAAVLVADSNGVVLARAPEMPGVIGTVLPDRFRPLLDAGAVGTAELSGIDGTERVFAYVPLAAGVRHIFVAIGIDREAAMAGSDEALQRSLLSTLAALLLSVVAVFLLTKHYVHRPVEALVAATRRWRAGDLSARARLPDDGSELGLLGRAFDRMAEDLDAQTRAKQATAAALQASEARYRALVESAPQKMWVNRPDGTLEFVNAAFRTYTGRETTEATRMNDLHPDDVARIQRVRAHAIAAGEPHEYELRLRRADGAYRWHLSRTHPIRQEDHIVAWFGGAVDIHDIHRAKEAAEEADRSKSRFLAAASHDLRQPLQSILLFAEALRPHLVGTTGRDRLDSLQHGLDVLKELLDSLLDISQLDAGIVAPQFEVFRASEVLEPLDDAYAPIARGKGLEWQVTPCDATVCSDRVLLGRMLRNLVENAIRYTERGRILIDGIVQADRLLIEVQDTGCGIPMDQLGRIFDEFHQVGNSERDRSQGLGLGLAIVRRLSKLLDHPVDVHSRPTGGSVFSIAVPLAVPADVAAETGALPPAPAEPAPVHGQHRRLAVVVDDDKIVLMALETILREWDFDVVAAESADRALEHLKETGLRPDILIVDYRLRAGKVGTDVVVRVREMCGRDVPGIIVTGEIGPEPQNDATSHGLGLLQKPVTPRLLEAALARHMPGADTMFEKF